MPTATSLGPLPCLHSCDPYRFHSFYPWHTGGDYMHLCNEKDMKMLPWIRTFNKYDLYTKTDSSPDIPALIPYYQGLVDKYCPGKLQW